MSKKSNVTFIAISDYVQEQVWEIFDSDSLSILTTVEKIICQRKFSLESVDAVLERRQNFISNVHCLSHANSSLLEKKGIKNIFRKFSNCFFCII